MKFVIASTALLATSALAFTSTSTNTFGIHSNNGSQLSMVLEKAPKKKLAKIEVLKSESSHLTNPLKDVSSSSSFCTDIPPRVEYINL